MIYGAPILHQNNLKKTATVKPLHKPEKSPKDPTSKRPILFKSHQGKNLEAIISKRLNYNIEANNLLSKNQAGFRRDRQTLYKKKWLYLIQFNFQKQMEKLCARYKTGFGKTDSSATLEWREHLREK